MELKLIGDKGAAGTFQAPDALFARDKHNVLLRNFAATVDRSPSNETC